MSAKTDGAPVTGSLLNHELTTPPVRRTLPNHTTRRCHSIYSLTELNETIELLTVGMDSVETDVDTMVGAITLTVEAKTNTTSSTMAAALAAAQATASGRLAGVTASISGVLLLDRCSHCTVQSPIL